MIPTPVIGAVAGGLEWASSIKTGFGEFWLRKKEDTMGVRQPRYSKEEFARRGQAIYEKRVRPQVEEGNTGRVVAVDVETEEFEVADDPIAASDRLFARCPDAQPWLVRSGHRALHRFGVAHASGLT